MSDSQNRQSGNRRSPQRRGSSNSTPQRRAATGARARSAYQATRNERAEDNARYAQRRPQQMPPRDNAGSHTRAATINRAHQGSPQKRSRKPLIFIIVILIIVAALAFALPRILPQGESNTGSGTDMTVNSSGVDTNAFLPTPIMAESEGVTLHSAVRADELTEILIHNASYTYACPLTTQLTEATNTDIIAAHGTGRVATEQPTGDEWLKGEFIRCYRAESAGPKMSAIDCGGPVGATVYAPVTGKVVLVKNYKLYEQYDDIQVHIQPEGRDDLDVVLIHLENAQVKAGDMVEAGVTPLAQIRDVYAYIGDSMQLRNYTAVEDNGNHTHIQVNNALDKKYHGLDDLK